MQRPAEPGASTQPTAGYRSVGEVARDWPSSRAGKRTSRSTVTRWITTGVLLTDGRRVRLDAMRLPSGWVVSDQAIEAFLDALTRDRLGGTSAAAESTPSGAESKPIGACRRRAYDRAERDLDRIGV